MLETAKKWIRVGLELENRSTRRIPRWLQKLKPAPPVSFEDIRVGDSANITFRLNFYTEMLNATGRGILLAARCRRKDKFTCSLQYLIVLSIEDSFPSSSREMYMYNVLNDFKKYTAEVSFDFERNSLLNIKGKRPVLTVQKGASPVTVVGSIRSLKFD